MNTPAGVLIASIEGREVGTLRDEAGVWSFEYAPSWIDSADTFDLVPALPRAAGRIIDGGTQRPVQWFFDNLLPEETARDLLAREAQIPSADAFGLLTYYGRESAGALVLLSPGEPPAPAKYRALPDEELHERISRLPQRSLAEGAPKRMSLAGAQHKLAVAVRDGHLFHPVGDAPSTHILKPNHMDSDSYPSSTINEFFCMRLALRMGLPVPAVQMRYVPDQVYLIERFDRRIGEGQVRRLHAVDACQLLALDRSFKYRQSTPETLVRCIELCQSRAQARQQLLAWTLFNLIIGNGNAHLKNVSFLVEPGGIALAPFYDLVSTESYRAEIGNLPRWPQIPLTMPIGKAMTFADITRKEFMHFAEELGSAPRTAQRLLDEFCGGIEEAAKELHEELEKRPAPAGILRAAEMRMLNIIRFAAIRQMVQRLK